MPDPWWITDRDAPFATLVRLVETYCHPEAYDEAYEDFQAVVTRPTRNPIFDRFKDELIAAIRDPSQIPGDSLYEAAQYADGSDAKFLARLWRDLYPDEPLPTA